MNSDDAFLHALFDKPDDETTRLVYADWLEDRGDPQSLARGEFLRVGHQLRTTDMGAKRRTELEARLYRLAEVAGLEWANSVHPYLKRRARVLQGVFWGMEGFVDRCQLKDRSVSITLMIFGRPVPVELLFDDIEVLL
jgi:uncharacterized protein (TIGR02996 family)